MVYTRRRFLALCADALAALGLSAFLPPAAARAAAPETNVWETLGAKKDAFRALIFCDSQCGESYDVWRTTIDTAFARHGTPDFFAILGDLVDCGASDWHWQEFFHAMGAHASEAPLVPVMGNHECYGEDWQNHLPDGFLSRFSFPPNGSVRFPGYYYAFDCGPAHFTVLNTQWGELDGLRPGLKTEQLVWLKQALSQKTTNESQKKWQIVLLHKDILAYDEAQPDGTTGGFSDTGKTFLPLFDALGVDLVLSAHMHAYRNRGHIAQFARSESGPVYVMCGRAGNEYYYVPPDALDLVCAPDDHIPAYVTLACTPTSLTVEGWDTAGTRLDRFTLTK